MRVGNTRRFHETESICYSTFKASALLKTLSAVSPQTLRGTLLMPDRSADATHVGRAPPTRTWDADSQEAGPFAVTDRSRFCRIRSAVFGPLPSTISIHRIDDLSQVLSEQS